MEGLTNTYSGKMNGEAGGIGGGGKINSLERKKVDKFLYLEIIFGLFTRNLKKWKIDLGIWLSELYEIMEM